MVSSLYRKQQNGFTLVEILVVIAIISILAAVVVSSLNKTKGRTDDMRRRSDLVQIRNALMMYYEDNGAYPIMPYWNGIGSSACGGPGTGTASGASAYIPNLIPKYWVQQLPTDPSSPTAPCTGYQYMTDDKGQGYKFAIMQTPATFGAGDPVDPKRPDAWAVCDGKGCGF